MKLPELKEKLKSKYIVRVVAGVLTIALVGTGIGATAVFADKNDTAVTSEASSDSTSTDDIADDLMNSISLKDETADKEESVYLISDANGNVDKTIVVDHLNNKDKKDTIEDASNLSDIENVKGKETFEQSGDKITWQAGGNDIYYQGTASEEPPVTQKVTYYLDGKEISPEDLAGKSGKVKIRFDYTNTTSFTETVNGEKQTVSVPFAAITGLVLDDGFSNVEVTNGKVQANDTSNIVIGYVLPGLKESLGIDDEDLDDDVNIPEYMEVSADVENFSLSTAMTFVVNASDYVSSDGINTSSLDDMINELSDATTQLKDGSAELADGADTLANGVGTLKDSLGTFAAGMNSLQSGLKSYTDGASKLNAGINTLGNSTGSLVDGAGQLNSGAAQLASGSATLKEGVKDYTDGASQLNAGIQQLYSTLDAGLTDKQKAGIQEKAVKSVQDSFAGETGTTVKNTIYAGLRYKTDENGNQVDGDLYTNLYNGTVGQKFEENLDSAYDLVVNTVLSTAAGKESGTVSSDTLAATIKQSYKNASDVYEAALTASVTDGTVSDTDKAILANKQYQEAFITYKAIENMSASQLAEAIYAKTGKTDTLIRMTETQLKATLASNDNSAAIKAGVEEALNTLATNLSGACEQISEQVASNAAITGAQGTMDTIKAGLGSKEDAGTLIGGANALVSNNDTLNAGATEVNKGASQLSAGTQSLVDKIPALTSGIKQLVDGSSTLVSNNNALLSGVSQLSDGTTQIVSGVDQLADGSKTLADGAHTLADGIVQFNEEGINKILDAYNGDLKPLTNKLQAVIDAGEDYQTYSAIADGQTGSVKFIYKLASIESDSDK